MKLFVLVMSFDRRNDLLDFRGVSYYEISPKVH